jgi:hypothetical protein
MSKQMADTVLNLAAESLCAGLVFRGNQFQLRVLVDESDGLERRP